MGNFELLGWDDNVFFPNGGFFSLKPARDIVALLIPSDANAKTIAVHWYSATESVEEGGWAGVEAAVGGFGRADEGGGAGAGVCG